MDRHYADTVRLLLSIAPEVFDNDIFAMKGRTAINLFVQDTPRLSEPAICSGSSSRCRSWPWTSSTPA